MNLGTRLSLDQRRIRARERKEQKNRIEKAHAEAREIVATGVCPVCGAALKRNLALTGWVQCEQYGAPGFRKDPSKPACPFQCFTE